VMVIGGFYDGSPTNMVQTIDFSSKSIEKIASLNKNRYSHGCTAAMWGGEEYIVAAGGFEAYSVSNTVEYISTCDSDEANKPTWKSLSAMQIRRYDFQLSIYGTQLAAFGGQPTIDSEQIEVYNADAQVWELIGRKIKHHDRHYFTSVIVPIEDLEVSVIEGTTAATTESEPTTVESEPTTVESEPNKTEPEPNTTEPEPNTTETEPDTTDPNTERKRMTIETEPDATEAETAIGYGYNIEAPGHGDSNEESGQGDSNEGPYDEVEPQMSDLSYKYKDSHDYHEYSKYL